MAYAKIEDKVVVFKTYETDTTLTEIPDDVCCGMIQNEDGTFSNPPKQFDDEMELLRDRRNQLLIQTDWMGNSDVTMSNDWKTYRQALRDITKTEPVDMALSNITFPTKPS